MAINWRRGRAWPFKDRYYLLETDPHRFLEGTLIGTPHVIEAQRRLHLHPRRISGAIRAKSSSASRLPRLCRLAVPRLHIRRGAGAYIGGEDPTAAGKHLKAQAWTAAADSRHIRSRSGWPWAADPDQQYRRRLFWVPRHRGEGRDLVEELIRPQRTPWSAQLFGFMEGVKKSRHASSRRRASRCANSSTSSAAAWPGGATSSTPICWASASGGILPAIDGRYPARFRDFARQNTAASSARPRSSALSDQDSIEQGAALNLDPFLRGRAVANARPAASGLRRRRS